MQSTTTPAAGYGLPWSTQTTGSRQAPDWQRRAVVWLNSS
jgi:hypothetical protein